MDGPSPRPPAADRVLGRRRVLALGAAGTLGVLGACRAAGPAGPAGGPPEVPPRAPGVPTLDAALPLPSGPALRRGRVIDARDHGARGDGTTDDTDALLRALEAARTAGGPVTVALGPGTFAVRADGTLRPAPGTTLAGEPGRTTLRFGRPGRPAPDGFGVGVLVEGADVTLDGLVLERGADADTVLVRLGRTDRATLSRLALLGHAEAYPSSCHGVQTGTAGGVSTDLRLADTVVSACDYGLFQANGSTAVTVGVEVTGCTFVRDANTDLEFNSPSGSFRRVRVEGCAFRDNDSPGFAVGIAYCADVTVANNRMTNYRMEAVHVEDWSSAVAIENNVFVACGLREFAHVQVISGSSGVRITGNVHDATMNTAAIPIVGALPGGRGLTAGGRAVTAPTDVSVVGNRMTVPPGLRAVSFDEVVGGSVLSNRVDGPAAATTSTAELFRVAGGADVRVAGNVVGGVPR